MSDPRSRIPSVDRLLGESAASALIEAHGHARVVDALRGAVAVVRERIGETGSDHASSPPVDDPEMYLALARNWLRDGDVPSLRTVINATGVVLHTNLGRAPLAQVAVEAMRAAASEYSNLEFDVENGVRGSRYVHCVSLLTELTGAEDALVVNNAAGALVLALNTLARGEGVAVSRGELVEIGGGFRIPEVLERAGARLVEVGSTNRTRVADYEAAIEGGSLRALLKVHRSNFRITGFTEEATVEQLADMARTHGLPLIHDLGSGLMLDADRIGLPAEPRAGDSLAAGADLVVVSGDKLMGATQAGVLVGRAELIGRMRKNPLCRALRVDKVTLAGLEATLRLYRDPARALTEIPVLRMLAADPAELEAAAIDLLATLGPALEEYGITGSVVPAEGAVGGGTFPETTLSSSAVRLECPVGADRLARTLRNGSPPVVGRVVDDALLLDVRTVLPGQGAVLRRRVVEAAASVMGTDHPGAGA